MGESGSHGSAMDPRYRAVRYFFAGRTESSLCGLGPLQGVAGRSLQGVADVAAAGGQSQDLAGTFQT